MAYKDIIRVFDERREKLASLLADDRLDLKEERAHQIQGAIDEIELFLLTLRQHQDQAVQRNFLASLELPREKKGLFARVFGSRSTRNFRLSESYRQAQE